MADYNGPPPGATGEWTKPIDPEAVKVDSHLFPKYRVFSVTEPPRWVSEYKPDFSSRFPMVQILPSDEWVVRHTVNNLFLIESKSYNQRQNDSLREFGPGSGAGDYLYTIFITKEGLVTGGWKLLHNPKRVILSSDRRTFFSPPPWGNKGWEEIKFEKMN